MNKFDVAWIACLGLAIYLWFYDTVPFAVPWGWVFFAVALGFAKVSAYTRE